MSEWEIVDGVELRDYFAAQIAAAIYTQFQNDGTAREYDYWREGIAIEAYRLADEMLDVRERAPGSDGAREDNGNG